MTWLFIVAFSCSIMSCPDNFSGQTAMVWRFESEAKCHQAEMDWLFQLASSEENKQVLEHIRNGHIETYCAVSKQAGNSAQLPTPSELSRKQ